MIFTIILIASIIGYVATGVLLSRNYHAEKAITWEKNYQKCSRCHRYSNSFTREHHNICHDDKSFYITASVLMVFWWPLFYPISWTFSSGKSLKAFYLSPVVKWSSEQDKLIEQKNAYKEQLKQLKGEDPSKQLERQILNDAIKGIEAQLIVRN